MKVRFPAVAIAGMCLSIAALSTSAQAPRPSGPPPGGSPQGPPPPGGMPGTGPGFGGQRPERSASRGNAKQTHGAGTSQTPGNAVRSSAQFGPVGRWWDDKLVVQTVGITTEQQKKMDGIFNENKPAILASYKALLKEQSKLQALTKDPNVDQAKLFSAIDAVSQARGALQKATAQMLLQIRKEMDPGQIEKLEKLPE